MVTSSSSDGLKCFILLATICVCLATWATSKSRLTGGLPSLVSQPKRFCSDKTPGVSLNSCLKTVNSAYNSANLVCSSRLLVKLLCELDCKDFVLEADQKECLQQDCSASRQELQSCVTDIVKSALAAWFRWSVLFFHQAPPFHFHFPFPFPT